MAQKVSSYVLGINGLGILPSACLLKDGDLVAMAEEERFTRIKGSTGLMPIQAVGYCLESAGIGMHHLDRVMFAWDCNYYPWGMLRFMSKAFFMGQSKGNWKRGIQLVGREIQKYRPRQVQKRFYTDFSKYAFGGQLPRLEFVSHHHSHAASGYFSSGFKQAHVLVIDGSGESQSTTLWFGKGLDLKLIKTFNIPNSLGWFYQTITEFLGFHPNNHEGKTMALAAYGRYNAALDEKVNQLICSDGQGNYTFNPIYAFAGTPGKGHVFSEELKDLLGEPRQAGEPITDYYKDLAFATQKRLELIVVELLCDLAKDSEFSGNLCLAGGVGLNCKMNGIISELPFVKQLFIPPFTGDNGTSYGAAKLGMPKIERLVHAYWGPAFSADSVEKNLQKFKLKYTKEDDISDAVAELLGQNKIVAWFQGRMEVGARALGARSILANPTQANLRDYINTKVKGRELWRPFAASIIAEKKFDFLTEDVNEPFMTKAIKVREEMAPRIPAVIHVDQTSRFQIVSKEDNSKYHKLISKLGDITGVYAVLNTSFNLNEEPIVCTPEEAIRAFLNSGIDYLAIEDFLISKESNAR